MDFPPLYDGRYKARVDRFWPRVDVGDPEECWEWTGPTDNTTGYGTLQYEGRPGRPHRVAYELVVGKPPPRFVVHHRCENKTCCNPAHMEALSRLEHASRHPRGCSRAEAGDGLHIVCLTCKRPLEVRMNPDGDGGRRVCTVCDELRPPPR